MFFNKPRLKVSRHNKQGFKVYRLLSLRKTDGGKKFCKIMKCNLVHRVLSQLFRKLGYEIGLHPFRFIIFPLLLSAILSCGFLWLHERSDPVALMYPVKTDAEVEQRTVETLFPMNSTFNFNPGRLYRKVPFGIVVIEVDDGRSVLEEEIFQKILYVDEVVHNITITSEGRQWNYSNLCARKNRKCFENRLITLKKKLFRRKPLNTYSFKYPINVDLVKNIFLLTGASFGGVTTDEKNVIKSARSLRLSYFLDDSDTMKAERSELWEKEFVNVMSVIHLENITVAIDTSTSLLNVWDDAVVDMIPYAAAVGIVILILTTVTCMMMDWVRSKPWLGIIGCSVSGIAVLSAFGLLIFCGVPFTNITLVGSFLMLGIGMDDSFMLLAAWRRSSPKESVPDRMAECFCDAGVSITITSLTNIVAFLFGMTTSFPGIVYFCAYTATSVLFTFVFQIFVFGGALAAHGYMEEKGLHALVCVSAVPRSAAKNRSTMFQLFCTGGRNKEDPDNPEDNKEHMIMVFFRDYLGKALTMPPVKIVVICVYLIQLAFALWGCLHFTEKMEMENMVPINSYSFNYYKLLRTYYRDYPLRIQVVINQTLNYADPKVQNDVENLLQRFENSSYVANSELTESWLRGYKTFLNNKMTSLLFALGFNSTDKTDFLRVLRDVFLKVPLAADAFKHDIVFNDNKTEIIASRFVIQAQNITDTTKEKGLVIELREIAKSAPFPVTVHNYHFFISDHLLLIRYLTVQTIACTAAAMLAISIIFIPKIICALWVAFAIISIEVSVAGYLSLWGAHLESVTMIALVMCIGFSVDYSAHTCYAYISHKGSEPNERILNTLYLMGHAILQGSLTTICSVIPLAFTANYGFIVIFKTMTLVVIFGLLHAFFLLPVALSLTEYKATEENLNQQQVQVTGMWHLSDDKTERTIENNQPSPVWKRRNGADEEIQSAQECINEKYGGTSQKI